MMEAALQTLIRLGNVMATFWTSCEGFGKTCEIVFTGFAVLISADLFANE